MNKAKAALNIVSVEYDAQENRVITTYAHGSVHSERVDNSDVRDVQMWMPVKVPAPAVSLNLRVIRGEGASFVPVIKHSN